MNLLVHLVIVSCHLSHLFVVTSYDFYGDYNLIQAPYYRDYISFQPQLHKARRVRLRQDLRSLAITPSCKKRLE